MKINKQEKGITKHKGNELVGTLEALPTKKKISELNREISRKYIIK